MTTDGQRKNIYGLENITDYYILLLYIDEFGGLAGTLTGHTHVVAVHHISRQDLLSKGQGDIRQLQSFASQLRGQGQLDGPLRWMASMAASFLLSQSMACNQPMPEMQ